MVIVAKRARKNARITPAAGFASKSFPSFLHAEKNIMSAGSQFRSPMAPEEKREEKKEETVERMHEI
jgi:hypothetical protein